VHGGAFRLGVPAPLDFFGKPGFSGSDPLFGAGASGHWTNDLLFLAGWPDWFFRSRAGGRM
jgi:hypothetical protein